MRKLVVLCLVLFACAPPARRATPGPSARASATPEPQAARALPEADDLPLGRLPTVAVPIAYDVRLRVRPEHDELEGSVAIRLRLGARREFLWLHGRGLRVKQAQATLADGRLVQLHYRQMTPDGVARVDFAEAVESQELTLSFSYDASYAGGVGLRRVVLSSGVAAAVHAGPFGARAIFPCFDEPRFKAPFTLSLDVAAGHGAFGGTPAAEVGATSEGLTHVRFAPTPPLSPHGVALAVGALEVVEAFALPPTPLRSYEVAVRVAAPAGVGGKLAWVRSAAPRLIEGLERLTGSAFPFASLEVVALPGAAWTSGAGIVIGDAALLLEEGAAAPVQRRDGLLALARGLARQWFGASTTAPWWDEGWVDEGLVRWSGARAAHLAEPSLGNDVAFAARAQAALDAEGSATARPLYRPIESAHDIRGAADELAHDKGAAVFGMFADHVGADGFARALALHLGRARFGTAGSAELLSALGAVAGAEVAAALQSFVEQPGAPRVDMALRCAGGTVVTLRQARYSPLGSSIAGEHRWGVPVCVQAPGAARACTLLTQLHGELSLASRGCPPALELNPGGVGYFRVGLPPPLRQARLAQLDARSGPEKIALAGDVVAAFEAGLAGAAESLEAARRLLAGRPESARRSLQLMREARRLLDEAQRPALDGLLRAWVRPVWVAAGAKARAPSAGTLGPDMRGELARFLILEVGDELTRRELAKPGASLLARPAPWRLSAEEARSELTSVSITAALLTEPALGAAALAAVTSAADEVSRSVLVEAVSGAGEPLLAAGARALALDAAIPAASALRLAGASGRDEASKAEAWRWLQDNLDALRARLPIEHRRVLPGLAAGWCDAARAREVEAWFVSRLDDLPGAERALAASVEAIELCAARVEAHREELLEYLERVAR